MAGAFKLIACIFIFELLLLALLSAELVSSCVHVQANRSGPRQVISSAYYDDPDLIPDSSGLASSSSAIAMMPDSSAGQYVQ